MNKSIRFISVILMGLISFQIYAYDFESDGIRYNILSETDRTIQVTTKKDWNNRPEYSGSIVIPSKVIYQSKTYTVTGIEESAFYSCEGLTSITLPNSITTIGNWAFSLCENLTSLELPNSITTIGDGVFNYCSSLKSLTLPNSITAIGYYAFRSCWFLRSITLPNSLTSIVKSAFQNCNHLTSITLPNSITSIGESAFEGCSSLTSITLPNSITSIGYYAFSACSNLENIFVADGNTMFSSIDGVLYDKDASTLIRCPLKKGSVTLPNSLITIGVSAFSGCIDLISLTLPNSLTSIGKSAFKGCSGLKSITLPNSITAIGYFAFEGCSGLKSITLPNSLTTIRDYAFSECDALERINMLRETPIKCYLVFSEEALKNAILYIPIGTLAEYEKVDPWRNFWNIKEVNFAGINEIEADDMSLRLIWNNGILSIDGIDENESITIYDMSGHVVHSGTGHSIEYLVPGIYIVKAGKRGTKFAVPE